MKSIASNVFYCPGHVWVYGGGWKGSRMEWFFCVAPFPMSVCSFTFSYFLLSGEREMSENKYFPVLCTI